MNFSDFYSNFEQAVTYIRGCSVVVRTRDANIPVIISPSQSNCRKAVQVYSGDYGKGVMAAVAAFALFSSKDLLSIIGLATLTFAASTFQITYYPQKTSDRVIESVKKFFWN